MRVSQINKLAKISSWVPLPTSQATYVKVEGLPEEGVTSPLRGLVGAATESTTPAMNRTASASYGGVDGGSVSRELSGGSV